MCDSHVRDAQFHSTSMHKLPTRHKDVEILTEHQNEYHRDVTRFINRKKMKSYILRMDNLRSEFEELGFEFYKSLRTLNDLPTSDNTKKLGQ